MGIRDRDPHARLIKITVRAKYYPYSLRNSYVNLGAVGFQEAERSSFSALSRSIGTCALRSFTLHDMALERFAVSVPRYCTNCIIFYIYLNLLCSQAIQAGISSIRRNLQF